MTAQHNSPRPKKKKKSQKKKNTSLWHNASAHRNSTKHPKKKTTTATTAPPLSQADRHEVTSRMMNVFNASLVVVGAHLIGSDTNDVLKARVLNQPWKSVLLVEASPPVFDQLRAHLSANNPFAAVPQGQVHARNNAVCPNDAAPRPFYTFNATDGLPYYSTQIASFDRSHLERHFAHMLHRQTRRPPWTLEELYQSIGVVDVPCQSLERELRWLSQQQHEGQRVRAGVLLIDTEGLDCAIVAAQDWCALSPDVLVYEHKHCPAGDRASAVARVSACHVYPSRPSYVDNANTYYIGHSPAGSTSAMPWPDE